MTNDEKNDYFAKALEGRSVTREGKDHHEYNVRITSYPERSKLEQLDLPSNDLKYMLELV